MTFLAFKGVEEERRINIGESNMKYENIKTGLRLARKIVKEFNGVKTNRYHADITRLNKIIKKQNKRGEYPEQLIMRKARSRNEPFATLSLIFCIK